MPAGGPPRSHQPFGIGPKLGQATGEIVDPGVDFRDDLLEGRIGRERVADQRDVDAVRHRARREQRKGRLRAHLPIAAVNEKQRRRIRRRFQKVDAVALAGTVLKIEIRAMRGAHFRRKLLPAFDRIPAAGDRRTVVETAVERLLA